MNDDLKYFAAIWFRVAAAALAPVLFAAFVALPQALGRHPGELCATASCNSNSSHMT